MSAPPTVSAYSGIPTTTEASMLILLTLPVIAAVAAAQRYLQCCAPSNLLARRVRAATPTFRMAVSLLVPAAVLLALPSCWR